MHAASCGGDGWPQGKWKLSKIIFTYLHRRPQASFGSPQTFVTYHARGEQRVERLGKEGIRSSVHHCHPTHPSPTLAPPPSLPRNTSFLPTAKSMAPLDSGLSIGLHWGSHWAWTTTFVGLPSLLLPADRKGPYIKLFWTKSICYLNVLGFCIRWNSQRKEVLLLSLSLSLTIVCVPHFCVLIHAVELQCDIFEGLCWFRVTAHNPNGNHLLKRGLTWCVNLAKGNSNYCLCFLPGDQEGITV